MKKYLLLSIATILLPMQLFAFSLLGSPVKVPDEKQYIISNNKLEKKASSTTKNNTIDTTLLVYNIKTPAIKDTKMLYIKDNCLHSFDNSSWATPVSKMTTIAVFEYLLANDIVENLAFRDINIHQDFTLSGTSPYGPIVDLDNKKFTFYITFYLKNEKNFKTAIKTIRYQQPLNSDKITADTYVKLTNHALDNILKELKQWVVKSLNNQKTN